MPKDARLARELFELAISLGGDDAMYSLGLLLLRGEGMESDPVEAGKWALLAAQGDTSAEVRTLLDVITQQLTPQQVEEAQARAASWTREEKTVRWTTPVAGSSIPRPASGRASADRPGLAFAVIPRRRGSEVPSTSVPRSENDLPST